jgi:tetratricopeptide (TPR) repeat protein
VAAQEKLGTASEGVLAERLVDLGNSYLRQNKYDEALATYQRAEKIYDKNPTASRNQLLYSLARYYFFIAKYPESESLFLRVLPLMEKSGDTSSYLLAWYRKGYALVLYARGKTIEAEKLLRECIATLKKNKAYGGKDVATSWHELATLFVKQGKAAEAEPFFKQAIEQREKLLGMNHPNLAASLEGYAGVLRKLGRVDQAATMEQRALAIRANQPFQKR